MGKISEENKKILHCYFLHCFENDEENYFSSPFLYFYSLSFSVKSRFKKENNLFDNPCGASVKVGERKREPQIERERERESEREREREVDGMDLRKTQSRNAICCKE
jgi:hypothetical protein